MTRDGPKTENLTRFAAGEPLPENLGPEWFVLEDTPRAAERAGVNPRFLERRRQDGDGPPFVQLSPRCIRYRPIDVKLWADQRLRQSTSDQGEAA